MKQNELTELFTRATTEAEEQAAQAKLQVLQQYPVEIAKNKRELEQNKLEKAALESEIEFYRDEIHIKKVSPDEHSKYLAKALPFKVLSHRIDEKNTHLVLNVENLSNERCKYVAFTTGFFTTGRPSVGFISICAVPGEGCQLPSNLKIKITNKDFGGADRLVVSAVTAKSQEKICTL